MLSSKQGGLQAALLLMTNIIDVGYRSTHYYAIDINGGKLLIDCGWPDTMPEFLAQLKRKGIAASEIRLILATHFHPDHAGLVDEFKHVGAKLILLENQREALMEQPARLHKSPAFIRVSADSNILISTGESRRFMEALGLAGEIIPTPGHSDDSVTLILDEGFAFTGDLPARFALAEDDILSRTSWDRIYEHKIRVIYPAHGNPSTEMESE